MGDDPHLHPSRAGWPHMDSKPHGATRTTHDHRPPSWERRAIILLAVGLTLCLVGLGVGAIYLFQAHQYIEGRGEYRDAETQRLEQRITDAVCDLLDQLPAGGLLERPRSKYGCGPGYPVSEIDPGQQERHRDVYGRGVAPGVAEPSTPREKREQIEQRQGRGERTEEP